MLYGIKYSLYNDLIHNSWIRKLLLYVLVSHVNRNQEGRKLYCCFSFVRFMRSPPRLDNALVGYYGDVDAKTSAGRGWCIGIFLHILM